MPKPKPRPRSFRTATVTNDTTDKFVIEKEVDDVKAYKEKYHTETATSTSSDVTFIQENVVTSGHFVNFDKLVDHNTPKAKVSNPIDYTLDNINNSVSDKSEFLTSRKEYTIDQESRVAQGYKEKSYIDVNRPFQAYSIDPYDVRRGVAEKVYTDRYTPTHSKEIVIVKEFDLKPSILTHPKTIYPQKDLPDKEKSENIELIHSYSTASQPLDSRIGVESDDFSVNCDSNSSPESHYRYD